MPDSNSTESDTPDHGEPIEASSTSEPEHPPGLGPDEPQPVDPAPRSDAPASASTREPERYGEGKWTNEELDSWYQNEHGGDATLSAHIEARDERVRVGEGTPLDETLLEMQLKVITFEVPRADRNADDYDMRDEKASEAFLKGEGKFRNLPADLKARYRDHIEPPKIEIPAETPAERPAADWKIATSTATITLPDGSTLTEAIGQDGSSSTALTDRAGNLTEEPDADYEPTGEGTSSTGGIGSFSPRILIFGGGGILSLFALGVVFLLGGGGASGPWSTTDPLNDFVATFAGTEAIENPSSAGDVTNMQVAVADGNTTVTVTFAGNAQGLQTEGGEELAAALQFIPVGDERFIDMLFKEDGETKISDPPAGASIRSTWTALNTLVFEITGLVPAEGATVRFATIQRLRSGHSTDEVLVSTGDEGSSLVTPEPVNAPSTRAPAPLVIPPCDVIDSALAASLAGTTTEPIQSGDDRRQNCTYPFPPGDGATGNSLVMEVVRNSAGGVLEAYRNNNAGAVETRSIVWSDEGEMWIHVEGDDTSDVSMLAYVDIPGSRRVYVTVRMLGPAGSASSMASAAETISALLNEAVLAAQP